MSDDDNKYGKKFLDDYLQVMGLAWRSEAEEARLVANPTAYAVERGLPVEPGAVVRLDRTQPETTFTAERLIEDWTAKPGEHILHIPAEELITDADLNDEELEMVSGGGVVIACYVRN